MLFENLEIRLNHLLLFVCRVRSQDDVLAGELRVHQGCLRHAPLQDGGVDGECRKGTFLQFSFI